VRAAAPDALVQASRHSKLLVVGGRERGRHDLSWLGSVPLHVVPRAHCPVVVVPTDPRLTGDIVVGVGVDGSALAGPAVAFAFAEAARTGAHVQAVMTYAPAYAGLAPDGREAADRREDARKLLERTLEPCRTRHPEVVFSEILSTEHPLRALRVATEDAGLVVVGSHGRGVTWRHALGSVSSALLRVATCPVVVIGPDACA
jgi:nucleotide-binding universal stress UspA family protein